MSRIRWVDDVSEESQHDGFTELLYPPVAKDRCCPELHLKNGGLLRCLVPAEGQSRIAGIGSHELEVKVILVKHRDLPNHCGIATVF